MKTYEFVLLCFSFMLAGYITSHIFGFNARRIAVLKRELQALAERYAHEVRTGDVVDAEYRAERKQLHQTIAALRLKADTFSAALGCDVKPVHALVHAFLNLPQFIEFEGIEFVPRLIHNGTDDMRLLYSLSTVDESSEHFNSVRTEGSFENGLLDNKVCDFLWLYEGIRTDTDLRYAILRCNLFLIENKLIIKNKTIQS